MEQDLITYEDKVALDDNPDIADINKVKDTDMNQIKNVINGINDGSQPLNDLVVSNIRSNNLLKKLVKGVGINVTDGTEMSSATSATSDYIPVDFTNNPNYYLSGLVGNLNCFVAAYNANKQFLGRTAGTGGTYRLLSDSSFTSGTPQGTGTIKYLRVMQYFSSGNTGSIDDVDNAKIQLEVGSTGTTYNDYISFNANPYVLWTNPNPTTSFASQSITLNDSIENYKYYEIIYIAYANASLSQDTFLSTGKLVGERTRLFYADNYARRRLVSGVSGTNMTFGDGGSCTTYGTDTWGTLNGLCVPYQILGYK